MTGISGKVVAITGASSGIGEATARMLAERGAAVALGARRTERLDKLAQEIRDRDGRAIACPTDVTRLEDVQRLADRAVAEFGRLDVLVSNAGISKIGSMADLDVDGWSAMIDVNLRGVLYGIAAALPVFRRQGHGHLVTTVSTAGLKIVPTQAVYAATKNAVRTLLEGTAARIDRRRAADNSDIAGLRPHRTRRLHRQPRSPRTDPPQQGRIRHPARSRRLRHRLRHRAAR